eukprot:CAMPEP_0115059264 /NCGR_PEP_ID=MMETSP0227-20121206/6812_1 /TAXON_ID=89957 /ORGANISM="Polarella glacialis, Strain CCMP 1383" /LENGTH=75 /DNA_ID=CAMNT_0002444349 /DNA_START=153 /DNA_END=380 /DNA_ORIENTATION=-
MSVIYLVRHLVWEFVLDGLQFVHARNPDPADCEEVHAALRGVPQRTEEQLSFIGAPAAPGVSCDVAVLEQIPVHG